MREINEGMYGHVIIRDHDNNVVSCPRNLRGILRYPVTVESIGIRHCTMNIRWINRATTMVRFADHSVMVDWIKRRRKFRNVPVIDLDKETT